MIAQYQRFKHDPENGSYGDCHRAAIASVLEIAYEIVPHFMNGLGPRDGDIFEQREKEFLKEFGLVPVCIPFTSEAGLEGVLEVIGARSPGVYFLVGGKSERGVGHTVVGYGNKIVHDPHPSGVGISGPMDDGLFWITFFCKEFPAP